MRNLTQLEELNISYNQISNLDVIKDLPNLKNINICFFKMLRPQQIEPQIESKEGKIYKNGEIIGFTVEEFIKLFAANNPRRRYIQITMDNFKNSKFWANYRRKRLKEAKICSYCFKNLADTCHHINDPCTHPEQCLYDENIDTICKSCHKDYHGF